MRSSLSTMDRRTTRSSEIAQIGDARVRVLRHEKNAGVVATFEDALRSATGDILFLCDDDDLWAPTKARQFLDAFESRPDVEIVMSRVRMIDEYDRPMPDSRINRRGQVSTWILAQSLHESLPGIGDGDSGVAAGAGAALSGARRPFCMTRGSEHGTICWAEGQCSSTKICFFIDRHLNNASRTKSLLRQIQTRVELLLAHVVYAFR